MTHCSISKLAFQPKRRCKALTAARVPSEMRHHSPCAPIWQHSRNQSFDQNEHHWSKNDYAIVVRMRFMIFNCKMNSWNHTPHMRSVCVRTGVPKKRTCSMMLAWMSGALRSPGGKMETQVSSLGKWWQTWATEARPNHAPFNIAFLKNMFTQFRGQDLPWCTQLLKYGLW